jgi:hypothetical protein
MFNSKHGNATSNGAATNWRSQHYITQQQSYEQVAHHKA